MSIHLQITATTGVAALYYIYSHPSRMMIGKGEHKKQK